jgi:hypothetical protein
METLKEFLIKSKSKTLSKFTEEELIKAKKILTKNNYNSKPILQLNFYGHKINIEDFEKSVKFLRGIFQVKKEEGNNSLKLFFLNFEFCLRSLLFFYRVQSENDLQENLTINFEKEVFKLNLKEKFKSKLQREKILKENNSSILNQNVNKTKKLVLTINNSKQLEPNIFISNSPENMKDSFSFKKKEDQDKENIAKKKFTGRFYLLIDNSEGFEISKKIIGKKGKNMKEILMKCKELSGLDYIPKDFLKLRLRGKGSSYREGNRRQECNDKLHLCVSAKSKEILFNATKLIEKLLLKLKKEYISFCNSNNIVWANKFYSKHIEA